MSAAVASEVGVVEVASASTEVLAASDVGVAEVESEGIAAPPLPEPLVCDPDGNAKSCW